MPTTPVIDHTIIAEQRHRGASYRSLAHRYGVPKSTLWEQLKATGVPQHKNSLYRYLSKEYGSGRSKRRLTEAQQQELQDFMRQNKEKLLNIKGTFLTTTEERNTTHRETSSLGDWRDDISA